MKDTEKNFIAGPLDLMVPTLVFNGLQLPVLADLPGGGFLQIVEGENPAAIPTPGKTLGKGSMLVLIGPEIANQLRPALRQFQADGLKGLENPAGAILHPSAPFKSD